MSNPAAERSALVGEVRDEGSGVNMISWADEIDLRKGGWSINIELPVSPTHEERQRVQILQTCVGNFQRAGLITFSGKSNLLTISPPPIHASAEQYRAKRVDIAGFFRIINMFNPIVLAPPEARREIVDDESGMIITEVRERLLNFPFIIVFEKAENGKRKIAQIKEMATPKGVKVISYIEGGQNTVILTGKTETFSPAERALLESMNTN